MRRPLAAVVVMAMALAACNPDDSVLSRPGAGAATPGSTVVVSGDTTTTEGSQEGFPVPVVEAYLEGCAEDASDRAYCECTIDQFERRLELDEFLALEDLSGGVVLEVATECLALAGMDDPADVTQPEVPLPPDNLKAYTDLTLDVVEEYWIATLPDLYGIAYEDISAAIPYFPSDGDLPECGPDPLPRAAYEDNAFYCRPGDYVAWDAEGLMPGLYTEFGDFDVALVIAHEWGHVIQARARVDGLSIMTELQADCFAGAWAGHIDEGGSDRLGLQPGDLDEAMGGYLLFRDPPGTRPGEPQAHGSAFDRVNAFQEGFFAGAEVCATYPDGNFSVVDIPLTQEDLVTGGDLPFADTAPLLATTLEVFWTAVYPQLFEGEYPPMTDFGPYMPSTGVLPQCEGLAQEDYLDNAFYCPDGDYVAWDNETLFPSLWQEIGDLAIGIVLAHEWATGAQARAGLPIEGVRASLQSDCFAGSWTGSMVQGIPILLEDGSETAIFLSAGDLDEAVAGFIAFGDTAGERSSGTAFERFNAFQDGFFNGAARCLDYSG